MKNHEVLADAFDDRRERDYEADFATETDCLYCGDLDIRLGPEYFLQAVSVIRKALKINHAGTETINSDKIFNERSYIN